MVKIRNVSVANSETRETRVRWFGHCMVRGSETSESGYRRKFKGKERDEKTKEECGETCIVVREGRIRSVEVE